MESPSSNHSCSIQVSGLRRAYRLGGRDVPALRGVDLDISEPGFYAIMGPSGSGKSTLLHLLAGLDRPDGGSVEVAGHVLGDLNETELTRFRRRSIGIVFQHFNLIPTLSAMDNVGLPGILDGARRNVHEPRATELLEALGMAHRADHRPDALSGGEQQRVAIARSLYFQPQILFADEPTGNLDSQSSEQLWSLLNGLAKSHKIIVLMVTHEPAAAVHCRRVFVLRDGMVNESIDVDGLDAAELATRIQRTRG